MCLCSLYRFLGFFPSVAFFVFAFAFACSFSYTICAFITVFCVYCRSCHVWGDMFPEAQLFVEMTNGGMTADESKFFLRAWLLCAGPDSGWVKSFNSAETTGQTQMPHRFGDGSLAVEANALRCYRAAQLLFRRASSEVCLFVCYIHSRLSFVSLFSFLLHCRPKRKLSLINTLFHL